MLLDTAIIKAVCTIAGDHPGWALISARAGQPHWSWAAGTEHIVADEATGRFRSEPLVVADIMPSSIIFYFKQASLGCAAAPERHCYCRGFTATAVTSLAWPPWVVGKTVQGRTGLRERGLSGLPLSAEQCWAKKETNRRNTKKNCTCTCGDHTHRSVQHTSPAQLQS